MMLKRRKQLMIGGAVLAALAVGSSASAGAATGSSSGSSSTLATLQGSSSGAPRASFTATHAPGTAAHENTAKTVTGDAADRAIAAPLASGRGGSAGAMNHVRDSWIQDLYLTDHEQYVRHHERLSSV
jgi:hypothetical protein